MPPEMLPLPDAEVSFDPHWLVPEAADGLFAALRDGIAWETHRIRLFGREVDSPRLSCWIGDAEAVYRYSGTRFEPRPWPSVLRPIRDRLANEQGVVSNSVLANLYRGGRDAMGWHSDDEPELGPAPVIASISLGATRRFVLKHRREPDRKLALQLGHGSLLLMSGETQRNYRHALPRTARPVGERINLTFRRVASGNSGRL
ncbi:alpha-ketoglutarate-dependent dioxygenase AlkB family protein [Novilysobacter erysipheiresistens]|uniref:Alpha-ketoglutarate-dependent dioxygenase AlkB n=1 Tax=Novilysobacter erysipheiresistens TaxID=1749332 RepID=A0ABU7YYT7_9GAMM